MLALLGACGPTQAPPPEPAPPPPPPKPTVDGTVPVVFLGQEEAREFLSTPDDYLNRLNQFNLQLRMATDGDVTLKDYAAFAGEQALDWTDGEKRRIARLLAKHADKIAGYGLAWPEEVRLIKTTGKEDFNAAYTRGNAIILPQRVAASKDDALIEGFLLHELFHIYSRHLDDARRDAIYAVIGFEPADWRPPLPVPLLAVASLKPRRLERMLERRDIPLPYPIVDSVIVNPDALTYRHVIPVSFGVRDVYAVPVLHSREPDPVAAAEMGLGNIMGVRLLLVSPDEYGRWHTDPELIARREAFAMFDQVDGFFQKTGRNTDYIIHPEEILADNFKLLISGEEDVPSPEILEKLDAVLREKPPEAETEPESQPETQAEPEEEKKEEEAAS